MRSTQKDLPQYITFRTMQAADTPRRSINELSDDQNDMEISYSCATYTSKNKQEPSQAYDSQSHTARRNNSNITRDRKNQIQKDLNQSDLPETSKKRVNSFEATSVPILQTNLSRKRKHRQDLRQCSQIYSSSSSSCSEVFVRHNDSVVHSKSNEFSKHINTRSKERSPVPHMITCNELFSKNVTELSKPLLNLQTEQDEIQKISNFRSCLVEIINNIELTLTSFRTHLSYLKKKYLDDECNYQEGAENAMFIFNCVISKLKEEIRNKESNMINSYHLWVKQLNNMASTKKNHSLSSNESLISDTQDRCSEDSSETDKDGRFISSSHRKNPLNNQAILQNSASSSSSSRIFESIRSKRRKTSAKTKHLQIQKPLINITESSNLKDNFVKPVQADNWVVPNVQWNKSKENDLKERVNSTPDKMPASTVKRVRNEYNCDSDVNSTRSTVIYNPISVYNKKICLESESDYISSDENNSSIDAIPLNINKEHTIKDSIDKNNALSRNSNLGFRDCSPVLSEITDVNMLLSINCKSKENIPPSEEVFKTVETSAIDTVRMDKFAMNDKKLKSRCYVYLRKLEDTITIP